MKRVQQKHKVKRRGDFLHHPQVHEVREGLGPIFLQVSWTSPLTVLCFRLGPGFCPLQATWGKGCCILYLARRDSWEALDQCDCRWGHLFFTTQNLLKNIHMCAWVTTSGKNGLALPQTFLAKPMGWEGIWTETNIELISSLSSPCVVWEMGREWYQSEPCAKPYLAWIEIWVSVDKGEVVLNIIYRQGSTNGKQIYKMMFDPSSRSGNRNPSDAGLLFGAY